MSPPARGPSIDPVLEQLIAKYDWLSAPTYLHARFEKMWKIMENRIAHNAEAIRNSPSLRSMMYSLRELFMQYCTVMVRIFSKTHVLWANTKHSSAANQSKATIDRLLLEATNNCALGIIFMIARVFGSNMHDRSSEISDEKIVIIGGLEARLRMMQNWIGIEEIEWKDFEEFTRLSLSPEVRRDKDCTYSPGFPSAVPTAATAVSSSAASSADYKEPLQADNSNETAADLNSLASAAIAVSFSAAAPTVVYSLSVCLLRLI